jgi:hypothetical protein
MYRPTLTVALYRMLAEAMGSNDISLIQAAISDAQAVFSDGVELDEARNRVKFLKIRAKLSLAIKKKDTAKIYAGVADCSKVVAQTDEDFRNWFVQEISVGLSMLRSNGIDPPDLIEECKEALKKLEKLSPSTEFKKDATIPHPSPSVAPSDKLTIKRAIEEEMKELEVRLTALKKKHADLG